MKVDAVRVDNRRHSFQVEMAGRWLSYPYGRADPAPTALDPITDARPDEELACEGFTYRLSSGREGTVHGEQVLEHNRDPAYMRDLLLYRLTLEAQRQLEASVMSRREIIRRLGTSPAQFYRLLDPANSSKSVDKVLTLLQVLDCDVDLVVTARP